MPQPRKAERIKGHHFVWLLGHRHGVWYADCRSGNAVNGGRHSLGTRSELEARSRLLELDEEVAIRMGLTPPSASKSPKHTPLPLAEGCRLYLEYAARPRVLQGVRESSQKRYRAVLDKFLTFSVERGLRTWNEITVEVLQAYIARLERKGYAYRTQYLEATTVKQAICWFAHVGHLPEGTRVELSLRKADGTDTYCWRPDEVRAILAHCKACDSLRWLGNVVLALATTGLRIGELANLRRTDVDLEKSIVHLKDESSGRLGGEARTTKSGRSRSFPVHPDLRPVLEGLSRHSDGFLFHGPLGGRLKPDTVRRLLIASVLTPLSAKFPTPDGEVGFANGRLHSFRHFFVSLCVQRNVPERTTMRWLGHRDSKMVNHYYHLNDDESRRMMERLDVFGVDGVGDVASAREQG